MRVRIIFDVCMRALALFAAINCPPRAAARTRQYLQVALRHSTMRRLERSRRDVTFPPFALMITLAVLAAQMPGSAAAPPVANTTFLSSPWKLASALRLCFNPYVAGGADGCPISSLFTSSTPMNFSCAFRAPLFLGASPGAPLLAPSHALFPAPFLFAPCSQPAHPRMGGPGGRH